jgi:hypothetical protein
MYVLQEITFTKCDEDGNEICDTKGIGFIILSKMM